MINSLIWFNGSVFFSEKLVMIWFKTIKPNHFNNLIWFGSKDKHFSSVTMNFKNSGFGVPPEPNHELADFLTSTIGNLHRVAYHGSWQHHSLQ
jgi:hypothetical protein